jgi:hypothetical protein
MYKLVYDVNNIVYSDAILSNVTISRELDEELLIDNIQVSGNVQFYGNDYVNLYNYIGTADTAVCYLYLDTENYNDGIECILFLDGDYNHETKTCNLKIDVNDKYKKLRDDATRKVNILELQTSSNFLMNIDRNILEFKTSSFTENGGLGSLWGAGVLTISMYARESFTGTTEEILEKNGKNGWEIKDGTTDTVIRDWVGNFRELESGDITTQALTDKVYTINEQIGGTTEYGDYTILYSTVLPVYYTLNNNLYYGSSKAIIRSFSIYDIIKLLIAKIDPSILIDDTFTGTWQAFNIGGTDITHKFLEFIKISDFINAGATTQQTTNSKMFITWESLTTFLREYLYIYYFIDSTNTLQFRYYPLLFEKISVSNSINKLNNLYGIDWTVGKNQETIRLDRKFSKFQREVSASDIDFLGEDVEFTEIKTNNIKAINISNYFFDKQDFIDNPSKYNVSSNNQYFVASTQQYNDNLISNFWNDTTRYMLFINETNSISTNAYLSGNSFLGLKDYAVASFGYISSNAISVTKGDIVNISFTVNTPEDVSVIWYLSKMSDLEFGAPYYDIGSTKNGSVNYSFTITETTDFFRLTFFLGNGASHYDITNVSITSNNVKQFLSALCPLSNKVKDNGFLSLSWLDSARLTRLPSLRNILVNNTLTTYTEETRKDFFNEITEINVPIFDIRDYNFNEYFETYFTTKARATSISLKLDGSGGVINLIKQ